MLLRGMKFQYKIYFITFILILFFSGSIIISQWNLRQISANIERLKNKNETLQETLLLLTDIEKLKRYIYEYSKEGNQLLIEPIETLFNKFDSIQSNSQIGTEKYIFNYTKLIENVKKYSSDFSVAKEHVPLNFTLREKVRSSAYKIEELINSLKLQKSQNDNSFLLQWIRLRKAILEVEKGVNRYFETDNRSYASITSKSLKQSQNILQGINQTNLPKETMQLLQDELEGFDYLVHQTIEHYRTYSMLTKVVMPGDTYGDL